MVKNIYEDLKNDSYHYSMLLILQKWINSKNINTQLKQKSQSLQEIKKRNLILEPNPSN